MYVRADVFERQMLFLQRHFSLISFSKLVAIWNAKDLKDCSRYCVITFDDGWLDNYLHAYPVLKKLRIPATIFLPTSFIGSDQWFWSDKVAYVAASLDRNNLSSLPREYEWIRGIIQPKEFSGNPNERGERVHRIIEGFRKRPKKEAVAFVETLPLKLGLEFPKQRLVMNWEEVKEMSENGISFGSHSSTHRMLSDLLDEEVQKELIESQSTILEKKVNGIPVFCYPGGVYNPLALEQVKKAGYQAAVTTHFGLEDCHPPDLFQLKRIGIHNDISSTIPQFSWRISGIEKRLSA
jgi:peptidoglycan/xylan/chitin deacetylase (PgdA/CDA1 family)